MMFLLASLFAPVAHAQSVEEVGFCRLMENPPHDCGTSANKRCVLVENASSDVIAPSISVCGQLGGIPNRTASGMMKGVIDPQTGKYMPVVPHKRTYGIYLPTLTNVTKGGFAYMVTLDERNLMSGVVGYDNARLPVIGWIYNAIVTPRGSCATWTVNLENNPTIRYNDSSCRQ